MNAVDRRARRGLHRLQHMSLAEVACRSRQAILKVIERATLPARRFGDPLRLFDAQLASRAANPGLRGGLEDRFFVGAIDPGTVPLLKEQLPDSCASLAAAADRTRHGQFDLLGYRALHFGAPVNWSFDPVANRGAQRRHWSRIDPLDASQVGDSKVIWELSRHQWCVTLAQACRLTGDKVYAERATELIEDWLAENPPGLGINWSSSLEVSLRLIAWCWVIALIGDARWLSPNLLTRMHAAVRRHATHIRRYLSYYFSPNTHLTGEALGLFYAGVLFPGFREAKRWRDLGARILVQESTRQITDDGVSTEQATCYHRYTIEIYLHFLLLAQRNGIAVPADVSARIVRMLEFLLTVNQPAGTMPNIGDADGGWVLPLTPRRADDCRGIFGLAAVAFQRPDFAWAAGGPAPEVAWLFGVQGMQQLRRLGAGTPAAPASNAFTSGGYVVMRSGWDNDALRLILHTGSVGLDATGAHAHADLLSVECSAFGEEYLVDSGSFCYLTGSPWRGYFRSTAAHSTVVVDGQSQAEPAGTFSWRMRPRTTLRKWHSTDRIDLADAEHAAYTRLPSPVCHRRRVLFVKPRYWVIVDDLTGTGEHSFELRFQFAPRPVAHREDLWTCAPGATTGGLWLKPFSNVPLSASVRQGREDPMEGWVSRHYGRREPAPVVVYGAMTMLPARVVTLLMPARERQAMLRPPHVEALGLPEGIVTGLRLRESGEIVLVEEDAIHVLGGAAMRDAHLAVTCG